MVSDGHAALCGSGSGLGGSGGHQCGMRTECMAHSYRCCDDRRRATRHGASTPETAPPCTCPEARRPERTHRPARRSAHRLHLFGPCSACDARQTRAPWSVTSPSRSLHAGVVIADHDREALERLARYGASARVRSRSAHLDSDGRISYKRKRPRRARNVCAAPCPPTAGRARLARPRVASPWPPRSPTGP